MNDLYVLNGLHDLEPVCLTLCVQFMAGAHHTRSSDPVEDFLCQNEVTLSPELPTFY